MRTFLCAYICWPFTIKITLHGSSSLQSKFRRSQMYRSSGSQSAAYISTATPEEAVPVGAIKHRRPTPGNGTAKLPFRLVSGKETGSVGTKIPAFVCSWASNTSILTLTMRSKPKSPTQKSEPGWRLHAETSFWKMKHDGMHVLLCKATHKAIYLLAPKIP